MKRYFDKPNIKFIRLTNEDLVMNAQILLSTETSRATTILRDDRQISDDYLMWKGFAEK